MKKNDCRYFIAIIPPSPITEEIHTMKLIFRDEYGSKQALRSPPHLTINMPFLLPEKKEKLLIETLQTGLQNIAPFEISTHHFVHFNEKVIYITINNNVELSSLQKSTERIMRRHFGVTNSTHKNNGFTPHITVAFRDLKKHAFNNAWEKYGNAKYDKTILVNSIALLKHNNFEWDIINTLKIN